MIRQSFGDYNPKYASNDTVFRELRELKTGRRTRPAQELCIAPIGWQRAIWR